MSAAPAPVEGAPAGAVAKASGRARIRERGKKGGEGGVGDGASGPRPGGRREGGKREEAEGILPQGMVGGKYNVVGLVALSGQERPAFLEHCTRVPLSHVNLPAIPAFPNPQPRTTSADDDSLTLASSLSALALTDTSAQGADQLGFAEAVVNAHHVAQRPAVEVMEAYQDVETKIIYLFLPYPEAEIGAVATDESYYSLEQHMFRWECQVHVCLCVCVLPRSLHSLLYLTYRQYHPSALFLQKDNSVFV